MYPDGFITVCPNINTAISCGINIGIINNGCFYTRFSVKGAVHVCSYRFYFRAYENTRDLKIHRFLEELLKMLCCLVPPHVVMNLDSTR